MKLHKPLLFILLIMLSCASRKDQKTPPLTLKVCTAQTEQRAQKMTFTCRTYSLYDMDITPRVSGYLQTIGYKQGMPVKKGQLLYRIEQGDYKNNVTTARANLAAARSKRINAENTYNRYIPLAQKRAISRSKLDAATAAYAEAIAGVNSAKAQLQSALDNLGYTSYRAPFDGIIGATNGTIGEFVGVGTEYTVINTLSNIDSIYVHLSIPIARYLEIAMADSARVKLYNDARMLTDISMRLSNGAEFPEKGIYKFTERSANNSTGSMVLHILFANPDKIIRAGEYVVVRAQVGAKKPVCIVPSICVSQQQGQNSVFVVDSIGKVLYRRVTLGENYGTEWEIKEGLKDGEMVLTEGLQKVHAGQTIKPIKI